jgi:hypothetical protein
MGKSGVFCCRRPGLGMLRAVFGLFLGSEIALALTCGSSLPARAGGEVALVNAPDYKLNLRAAPNANAAILIELPQGTRVRIIQSLDTGWKKVVVEAMGNTGQMPAQPLLGFVNGKYLTLVTNEPGPWAEYAVIKTVMRQYFDRSKKKGIEARSDGTQYYDINDCHPGSIYLPVDENERMRRFADIAKNVVYWSFYIPRLGYPDYIWRPVVDQYERRWLDKILRPETHMDAQPFDGYGLLHDALGPELGRYRKSHSGVGDIIWHASCGDALASVEIRTDPPGARVLFIATFQHAVCKVKNLNPDDPSACESWREPHGGKLTQVAGDYFYLVRWPDGNVRKGRFSFSGYSDGEPVTIREN